jgi:GTP cyclohydrolase I
VEKKVKYIDWTGAEDLAQIITRREGSLDPNLHKRPPMMHGIGNGGTAAALLLHRSFGMRAEPVRSFVMEMPEEATHFVMDCIHAPTLQRFRRTYGEKHVFALAQPCAAFDTVSFPWTRNADAITPDDCVRGLIRFLGDDPSREGLLETPARVLKSYRELYAGYHENAADLMKTFSDGACDEMVVLRNVEFYSTCEHHMLPFAGKAHVGYLPADKVIGISKLARLVDLFSRRLQIQERLTTQVATALHEHLQPRGVGVVLEAAHSCMTCRGVGKQNSVMVTSSLLGSFREPEVRAEFFSHFRG